MINIVIVGKDLKYCVNLMNFLNTQNTNIKVIAILKSISEFVKLNLKVKINILIIDTENYKLSDIIKKENLLKYTILIFNRQNYISTKTNIFNYVYKDLNIYSNILNKIEYSQNHLKSNYKYIILSKIKKELKFLELKKYYLGIKYLIDSVYILYHFENYYNCNLEKDVYPIIAEKYKKSTNNIKSNINYAIHCIYKDCNTEKLLNYVGEYNLYECSPKKLILSILEKIE